MDPVQGMDKIYSFPQKNWHPFFYKAGPLCHFVTTIARFPSSKKSSKIGFSPGTPKDMGPPFPHVRFKKNSYQYGSSVWNGGCLFFEGGLEHTIYSLDRKKPMEK